MSGLKRPLKAGRWSRSRGSAVRNVGLTAASGLAYTAFQAVALVLISRSEGAASTGEYLLSQTVATPIAVLFGLRLRDTLATEPRPEPFGLHLRALGWSYVICLVVAVPASMIVLGFGDHLVLFLAVLITNLAQHASFAAHGRWFRLKQFHRAAASTVRLGLANLVGISIGLATTGLTLGVVLAAAASGLLAAYDLWLVPREPVLGSSSAPRRLPRHWRVSSAEAMGLLQITTIRSLVAVLLGTAALGVFGVLSTLMRAALPGVQAVARVVAPNLADAAADGDGSSLARYRQRVAALAVFALPVVGLAGYFLFPAPVGALLGAEYGADAVLIALIAVNAVPLFLSILQANALLALGAYGSVQAASALSTVIVVAGGLGLIVAIGMRGAALALILGNATKFLYHHVALGGQLDRLSVLSENPTRAEGGLRSDRQRNGSGRVTG
jgi:O-antigen/teichoic acid export membrane protein